MSWRKITFRIFGQEVAAIEFRRGDDLQPTGITGGTSHNFEREVEMPVYEEHFGFGGPR